jgi:hypothetical protein
MKRVPLVMILLFLWPVPPVSPAAGAGGGEEPARLQSRHVSEDRFLEAFSRYLGARLRKPLNDLVVSKFSVSDHQAVPAGPLTLEVHQKERGPLVGHVRLGGRV